MPAALLADLARGLRDEWRVRSWRDARVRDAVRPVLAVLLAVLAAHALGLHDAWWAAITAFMVMQADVGASVYRGVLRVLGTLGGAALGLLLGPLGAQQPVDDRAIACHALQGALVVALLSIVMCQVHLAAFAQALVTTLAVLVVPLEAGAADTEARVTQRMVQRIAGCLAAGVLAFALLPLLAGHSLACQLALCAGTWLGAYLQRGPASVRYMATQFSAAFLMVFVQDSGWNLEAGAPFERLAGILAGVVALALVMQAWKHLRSLR